MRRVQRHADHARKTISEPEDADAIILAAKDGGGAVVGTARVHLKDRIPEDYIRLYSIADFGDFHPDGTSTTTKLMVARPFRRSTVAVRLAQACYDVGIDAGVSFNFIDCSPGMKSFFRHLGFRQVSPDFIHPEYGLVSPLVLALRDHEYLDLIRSPLRFAPGRTEHSSVPFFRSLLEHSTAGSMT